MNKSILQPNTSYSFSDYFKLSYPTKNIVAEFGYGYKLTKYVCPKYVAEDTPEPYREWLLAIADSLDEEVDETQYHKTEILQIFDLIARDLISPQEYARMKEEYNIEQLQQDKLHQRTLEIARKMLADGLDSATVMKYTGLSPDELATLSQ